MKKQMKNNKGITLTSLVIYIALMFVVLAILIRMMTYYTDNLSDMADVTWDAQIEKINIYFLDEAQKVGNEVTRCTDNEISFSSENTYTFIEEERTLYLNNSIKICENLYYCTFATDTAANGKTVIIVNVTRVEGELAKTIRYVLKGENQTTTEQNTIDPLYQEVEYIESTGTQYIDTGYIPNSNTSIEMKASNTATTNTCLYCSRTGGVDKTYTAFLINGKSLRVDYYNTQYQNVFTATSDTAYIYKQQKNLVYLDDTLVKTLPNADFECNYNMYLLASHQAYASLTNIGKIKLYYCKIWDGDTLVRDFVPCYRKADKEEDIVVGLYDKVEGKFYENAGSGKFNKGPDVVRENIVVGNNDIYINEEDYIFQMEEEEEILLAGKYKQVEYIESTGKQYIDTGYIPNSNTSAEIQFLLNIVADGSNRGIFGTRATATSNSFSLISSNNGILYSGYGTTNTATSLKLATSTIYTIKKEKNITIVNDNTITTANNQTFTSPYNLVLFSVRNGNENPSFYNNMNVYYCKIYDGDTLARDFVPCYNVYDGVAGLYDKVESKFYTSPNNEKFLIPEE